MGQTTKNGHTNYRQMLFDTKIVQNWFLSFWPSQVNCQKFQIKLLFVETSCEMLSQTFANGNDKKLYTYLLMYLYLLYFVRLCSLTCVEVHITNEPNFVYLRNIGENLKRQMRNKFENTYNVFAHLRQWM